MSFPHTFFSGFSFTQRNLLVPSDLMTTTADRDSRVLISTDDYKISCKINLIQLLRIISPLHGVISQYGQKDDYNSLHNEEWYSKLGI